jgi:hypothetical protein
MITTLLSIKDINDSLIHVLNLMIKIFTPIVALTMLYITIGRPMLRTVRRARLNERERQIEHQKYLRYKYDRQYNDRHTKAGLEKQETIVEE